MISKLVDKLVKAQIHLKKEKRKGKKKKMGINKSINYEILVIHNVQEKRDAHAQNNPKRHLKLSLMFDFSI